MVLVPLDEICPSSSESGRGRCPPVTRDIVEQWENTYVVSPSYALVEGKAVPIRLSEEFQQALVADITAGGYAVLLEFDWGQRITAVVDMIRKSDGLLPNWSNKKHKFRRSQHWYTYQNAIAFEPSKNVRWQVTLNGSVSFWFYVVRSI